MENPLVSIIVITYNSSKYVLETLESAYNQTYQNIELIVSDDASKDNTVAICRDWIESHKARFVRTELVTVEKNSGISANCNRGVNISKGIWIKSIAGDDLLLPNCIRDNINYVNINLGVSILFSKVILLGGSIKEKERFHKLFDYSFFNLEIDNQLKRLIISGNCISAATAFVNNVLYLKYGYYDESIPLMEDYPFWIKLLKKKVKFNFFSKETVLYRLHNSGISQGIKKNRRYKDCELRIACKYIFPNYFRLYPLKSIYFLISYFKSHL